MPSPHIFFRPAFPATINGTKCTRCKWISDFADGQVELLLATCIKYPSNIPSQFWQNLIGKQSNWVILESGEPQAANKSDYQPVRMGGPILKLASRILRVYLCL